MNNSKELCQPLCLPFECCEMDSRSLEFPQQECTHYFAELVLLRRGRLHVQMDREEFCLSPEEAVFFCPGVRHLVRPEDEEPVCLDLIRLDPDRLPPMPAYSPCWTGVLADARRGGMPMRFSAREAQELGLSDLCARCVSEAREQAFGYDLNVTSNLTLLCMALIRFWLSRGMSLTAREGQQDPVFALPRYIQQHLRDGLRVEDLAARCGLSYPWFAKKFREIYGISCKDYIEQIRVAQVEQYLRFTDLDLNQISEATGYADCSHMIKNFKRIMEITPGQYRMKRL